MKLSRILLLAVVLAACPVYGQSVFLKYGPVAGIQKSTGSTYQNTAATSADILSTLGSQTANTVLAAPNGSAGNPTFRSLLGADLPPINLGSTANGGVLNTSILLGTNGGTSNGFFSITGPATSLKTFTFPNASATVLTTNAAVTVAQGGTGLATLTANGVLLGEGTSNVSPLVMGADTVLRGTAAADPVATAVPNCGSSTTALNYSTTTHAFGCQTITAGGTPGGSNTQVQYNNSGALGGTAGLTWDNVNFKLALSVASAGAEYISLTSTNTAFIGMSMQSNTGHLFALRASTGGFFLADQTAGTNPISFDNSGIVTISNAAAANFYVVGGTTAPSVATSAVAIRSGGAVPSIDWISSSAAADQKIWDIAGNNSGTINFSAVNDAFSVTKPYLSASRSGNAIAAVAIGNATDVPTITGNGVTMKPFSGTFTLTYTGFTAGNALTATYYCIGNVCSLVIPGPGVQTSNATTFTGTGLPGSIVPSKTQIFQFLPTGCEDNSVVAGFTCGVQIDNSGAVTFSKNGSNSGWTAANQKGITTNMTITYILN